MDLSIAIRTATIANNKACFSVGGGIVFDSDPGKEFQETLDKGKTLMESLLVDFKTLNYLYYERAGQFAKSNGADEAIILNPDLTISETNTAFIFAIKDKRIIVPESDHVLDRVTINFVLKILTQNGYAICKSAVDKQQFYQYPNIIVTNALMGAIKVLLVDKRKIEHKRGICSMINQKLFNFTKR